MSAGASSTTRRPKATGSAGSQVGASLACPRVAWRSLKANRFTGDDIAVEMTTSDAAQQRKRGRDETERDLAQEADQQKRPRRHSAETGSTHEQHPGMQLPTSDAVHFEGGVQQQQKLLLPLSYVLPLSWQQRQLEGQQEAQRMCKLALLFHLPEAEAGERIGRSKTVSFRYCSLFSP
jgi:hypothetical protein